MSSPAEIANPESARRFASVGAVQTRLRKLLEPAINAKPFWIRAELSSVSTSGGRLYCDLVETKGARVVAKLRCTIWGKELELIRRRLREAGLEDLLTDGNEVGLCCHVNYHELYGLSISAVDIDPSQSLGALERKRQEIIEKLRREALLGKNAERVVPLLPQRIGLIASRDTAGYKDFVATLQASGFAIEILFADARVEGDDTQRSIVSALLRMSRLRLDVVIVLRGGGSRLSLSYLDNEAIARAIAAHRYPVWTAIGHEIDTSVLDAVAHTSFKTPTAVAEHIVARYTEALERLERSARDLRRLCEMRLGPERERIDCAGDLLKSYTERHLRATQSEHAARAQRFELLVRQRLTTEDARVRQARSELAGLARQRVVLAERALSEQRKSLHKTTGRAVERKREQVQRLRKELRSPRPLSRIKAEQQRCLAWQQILRAADPQRNLERGYALVYKADGTLVRAAELLKTGDRIKAQLGRGLVEATVDSVDDDE